MTRIGEPTLQSVLREKYNITDPLFAEGRFVALIGDHAVNLVCLGLSMKCLMVAKIVFSGDNMDYDLISITPLPLLSMSYECSSKKVMVRGQFKRAQIFQLCSTENQAEVWDNFTSLIRDVYQQDRGDGMWVTTSSKSDGFISQKLTTCYDSLSPRIPSHVDLWCNDTVPKYDGADYLNVKFDSFVNDASFLEIERNDLIMSNNNINNNNLAPTDTSVNVDNERKQDDIVIKFFRKLLPFCKDV